MEANRDHVQGSIPGSGNKDSIHSDTVIPVIEEHAVVQREIIETGKVRIRKTVEEDKAIVNLPIISETYDITWVPVTGQLSDEPPPPMRYEGDTMVIPVVKETTVMVKRYEVVEEVRITKKISETPLMQEITLRRESVHIERSGNGAPSE